MAGRARFQALKEELSQRTAQTFLLDADPEAKTHLDYVCDWLEDGRTMKQLAQDLTDTLGFELSATRLKAYLLEAFGDQTHDRLDQARKGAADAYAETAIAIADEDAETTVAVSRNASRMRSRQWLAERYNPQRYGQAKGLSLTINTGQLHLEALRIRPLDIGQVGAVRAGVGAEPRARLIEPGSDSAGVVVAGNEGENAA